MTNEELSRLIAEHLEPLKSLPNADECDFAEMNEFPTEYWIATHRLSEVTLMHVPEWQPRNMVTDPAMTVKLLTTKTKYGFLDIVDDNQCVGIVDRDHWEWIFNVNLTKGRSNFGRAVAEAFAKAKGLI